MRKTFVALVGMMTLVIITLSTIDNSNFEDNYSIYGTEEYNGSNNNGSGKNGVVKDTGNDTVDNADKNIVTEEITLFKLLIDDVCNVK